MMMWCDVSQCVCSVFFLGGGVTIVVMQLRCGVGGWHKAVVDSEGAEIEFELLLALLVQPLHTVGRLLLPAGIGHHGVLHCNASHCDRAVEDQTFVSLLDIHAEIQRASALLIYFKIERERERERERI